jgi:hypothetical protein
MRQLKFNSVFILALLFPGWLMAQPTNADENKIKAKVRSFYNANKNVLLGQNPDAALLAEPESEDLKENGAPELNRHKQVADKLRTEGLEYAKGQILDIRYDQLTVSGSTATLFATATYKLHFKPKDGVPEFTQYDETRELAFSKQGNKWVMTSQKLHIMGVPWDAGKDSLPTGRIPGSKGNPAQTTGKAQKIFHTEEDGYAFETTGGAQGKGGPLATGYLWVPYVTYNRIAAANYANAYAINSNSGSYRTYGNDCTNFVSQCLKAGGWTDAGGLLTRQENTSWFYGSFEATTSYPWAGAENHYWFHSASGRSTSGTSVYTMSLGDVLQADFGPTPDNNINHTVIVSKEDAAGNDFVSYHSNNTLNKPVSQFIAALPAGTSYYVWRVKSVY